MHSRWAKQSIFRGSACQFSGIFVGITAIAVLEIRNSWSFRPSRLQKQCTSEAQTRKSPSRPQRPGLFYKPPTSSLRLTMSPIDMSSQPVIVGVGGAGVAIPQLYKSFEFSRTRAPLLVIADPTHLIAHISSSQKRTAPIFNLLNQNTIEHRICLCLLDFTRKTGLLIQYNL